MLIKSINRASPDQIFLIARNSETDTTSTMSIGYAVVFDYQNTSYQDGFNVKFIDAAGDNLASFAGVVAEQDIAPGAYGLIQCYGHHDSIYVYGSVPTTTSQKNLILVMDASAAAGRAGLLTTYALATNDVPLGAAGGIVIPGSTSTVTDGTTIKGFIKAM